MTRRPPIKIERTVHPTKFSWPAWAVQEFGKMTDFKISQLLKIHYSTVAAERELLKIPTAVKRAPVVWTEEMIAHLGTQSDHAVAAALGISTNVVANKRAELEIGPSRPPTGPPRGPSPFWTAEKEALLGTESDQKIADQLGIPHHRVATRRRGVAIHSPMPTCGRRRHSSTGATQPPSESGCCGCGSSTTPGWYPS